MKLSVEGSVEEIKELPQAIDISKEQSFTDIYLIYIYLENFFRGFCDVCHSYSSFLEPRPNFSAIERNCSI